MDTDTTAQDLRTIAQVATLAPAAGAGIGKVLAEVLTADSELLPLMVAAAKDGLKANRSFWVKDSPGGGGHLETEPDMRIRTQTLFQLLAHMEGEPVKRIIHQHIGPQGGVDLGAVLAESPELREAMAKELQKANWKTSGQQAHKRPKKVEPAPKDGPADAF